MTFAFAYQMALLVGRQGGMIFRLIDYISSNADMPPFGRISALWEGICVFCRANDLRCKDVVNVKNGCRIGCVCDFEIDLSCARINALIIYGRWRLFGLLGRHKDIIIRWGDIQLIGEDTILVNFDMPNPRRRAPRR